ncbi:Uncharacterized protein APZ42_003898 [Daphnia magna]|uniref:Uncharacterized protein n=1 Tax=Daphnia magna TaxID=35525 RepID=A0A162F1B8_9CRUS|nr:Uncharacterized protein APZ42_003898 [Daphnia magna]
MIVELSKKELQINNCTHSLHLEAKMEKMCLPVKKSLFFRITNLPNLREN